MLHWEEVSMNELFDQHVTCVKFGRNELFWKKIESSTTEKKWSYHLYRSAGDAAMTRRERSKIKSNDSLIYLSFETHTWISWINSTRNMKSDNNRWSEHNNQINQTNRCSHKMKSSNASFKFRTTTCRPNTNNIFRCKEDQQTNFLETKLSPE